LLQEDSAKITELIYQYFQMAKSKEIEGINAFLDPKFTKFGDSPPYDRRDFDRALMLEQLQFASIADYDFKIEDLKVEVLSDAAIATFLLNSTGMIVDDYSFRGTTINTRSRVTVVLRKDRNDQWKMVHQHFSVFSG
jgi:ketosteroid isomerase-like protein